MSDLEDLILDICLRLSIKSTVRFRCVSKSWCASLSDPHFIYKNLTAANEHDLLLLTKLEVPHYSVVSHETLVATPLQCHPPTEVEVPAQPHSEHLTYAEDFLSPPCDDLVCFSFLNENCCVGSMGVWNLTTGETKMVPPLLIDDVSFIPFITLGFGFDEKREEYKIVQIVYLYKDYPTHFAAYVYSLSSSNNCWRKVGEPKMLFIGDFRPQFVYSRSYKDGIFYWGSGDLIMSFDMSSEVFNPISISLKGGRSSFIREICKLKEGSMVIISEVCSTYRESMQKEMQKEYEIWALLEVGVTQSWTKLAVIDWGCVDDLPFGIWRNELIFCSSDSQLLITDPFKRDIKKIHMDGPRKISRCLAWSQKGRTVC